MTSPWLSCWYFGFNAFWVFDLQNPNVLSFVLSGMSIITYSDYVIWKRMGVPLMTTSKFPYSHANFFSFSKFWVFDLKQTIRQYECRTEMRKLYLKWLYHKKIMEAAIDALSLTPPMTVLMLVWLQCLPSFWHKTNIVTWHYDFIKEMRKHLKVTVMRSVGGLPLMTTPKFSLTVMLRFWLQCFPSIWQILRHSIMTS